MKKLEFLLSLVICWTCLRPGQLLSLQSSTPMPDTNEGPIFSQFSSLTNNQMQKSSSTNVPIVVGQVQTSVDAYGTIEEPQPSPEAPQIDYGQPQVDAVITLAPPVPSEPVPTCVHYQVTTPAQITLTEPTFVEPEAPQQPIFVQPEVTSNPPYVEPVSQPPFYVQPEIPQAPVYVQPEVPREPVYVQPEVPRAPVHVQPEVPREPVYVQPEVPRAPVYVQPEVPRAPIYVQPQVSQPPTYIQPEVPPQPVYVQPEVPQGPVYTKTEVSEPAAPQQPSYVQPEEPQIQPQQPIYSQPQVQEPIYKQPEVAPLPNIPTNYQQQTHVPSLQSNDVTYGSVPSPSPQPQLIPVYNPPDTLTYGQLQGISVQQQSDQVPPQQGRQMIISGPAQNQYGPIAMAPRPLPVISYSQPDIGPQVQTISYNRNRGNQQRGPPPPIPDPYIKIQFQPESPQNQYGNANQQQQQPEVPQIQQSNYGDQFDDDPEQMSPIPTGGPSNIYQLQNMIEPNDNAPNVQYGIEDQFDGNLNSQDSIYGRNPAPQRPQDMYGNFDVIGVIPKRPQNRGRGGYGK